MTQPLIDLLFERPYEFNFFQAVRILELVDRTRVPVGGGGPFNRECVLFRALPSLNFPPSDIYSLVDEKRPAPRGQTDPRVPPPVLTVAFFGLTGPNGALPTHYTQNIIYHAERVKGEERHALREWLDLFNHRLTSLFYRAWEKYHFVVPFARYLRQQALAGEGTDDIGMTSVRREAKQADPEPFSLTLLNLVGMGARPLRDRLRVDLVLARAPGDDTDRLIDRHNLTRINDLALLYYSGLFAQRPRNASALAAIVGSFYGIAVKVLQFSGQWLAIPPEQQSRLTPGGNASLGMNVVAGERVWDAGSKFRIRIGPLKWSAFINLLPDASPKPFRKTFFLLCQMVRLYVGPEFDFEVQLVLLGSEVPECQLKGGTGSALGPCLGWNTWLKVGPMDDVDDAVFQNDERTGIDAAR